jgi:hypothetical protein
MKQYRRNNQTTYVPQTNQFALLPATSPMGGHCEKSLSAKFRIGSLMEIHNIIPVLARLQTVMPFANS